jgi:peroxiredoxin
MTFCTSQVADVLISDRHHIKYQLLSDEQRLITRKKVWANY